MTDGRRADFRLPKNLPERYMYSEKHTNIIDRPSGRVFRRVVFLLSIIASAIPLRAQSVCDSTSVYFHVSHSEIDPNLMGNGKRLSRMLDRLSAFNGSDTIYTLKHVQVIGAASPEGSLSFNRQLSRNRADSIFSYFAQRTSLPDSLTDFSFTGSDWSGLYDSVLANTRVPYRREVLDLLSDILDRRDSDGRVPANALSRLKRLRNGEPYKYIYASIFPELRRSRLFVEYDRRPLHIDVQRTAGIPLTMSQYPPIILRPFIDEESNVSDEKKPFYMALKTNLLYDALALPSLGAEFYLGRDWSIAGNWTYGWWDNDGKHRYWRAYGGDIALRRWFGSAAEKKPLTGHHAGIYAGLLTFDFEWGGTGYMGGLPGRTLWDRCLWMAGVEYGYSLPVAKRLNIDFTIGIGYLGGKYIKYEPCGPNYVWESTHKLNWFGPTKLEISLVWLIGRSNFNVPKGGNL